MFRRPVEILDISASKYGIVTVIDVEGNARLYDYYHFDKCARLTPTENTPFNQKNQTILGCFGDDIFITNRLRDKNSVNLCILRIHDTLL